MVDVGILNTVHSPDSEDYFYAKDMEILQRVKTMLDDRARHIHTGSRSGVHGR